MVRICIEASTPAYMHTLYDIRKLYEIRDTRYYIHIRCVHGGLESHEPSMPSMAHDEKLAYSVRMVDTVLCGAKAHTMHTRAYEHALYGPSSGPVSSAKSYRSSGSSPPPPRPSCAAPPPRYCTRTHRSPRRRCASALSRRSARCNTLASRA